MEYKISLEAIIIRTGKNQVYLRNFKNIFFLQIGCARAHRRLPPVAVRGRKKYSSNFVSRTKNQKLFSCT